MTEKAKQLASEIATRAETLDDLNGLIKSMMKSALERMLDTEMAVHLGRQRLAPPPAEVAQSLLPSPPQYPKAESAVKMVYLAIHDATGRKALWRAGERFRVNPAEVRLAELEMLLGPKSVTFTGR